MLPTTAGMSLIIFSLQTRMCQNIAQNLTRLNVCIIIIITWPVLVCVSSSNAGHPLLLSIAPCRSSKLYPMSAQSWSKSLLVDQAWPIHVWKCIKEHCLWVYPCFLSSAQAVRSPNPHLTNHPSVYMIQSNRIL